MIYERLRFSRLRRYTEYLGKQVHGRMDDGSWMTTYMREDLLGQLSPLAFVKCVVETKYTSAPLQTVACHLELVHSMDVLNV